MRQVNGKSIDRVIEKVIEDLMLQSRRQQGKIAAKLPTQKRPQEHLHFHKDGSFWAKEEEGWGNLPRNALFLCLDTGIYINRYFC